jgi:hypothetical protein
VYTEHTEQRNRHREDPTADRVGWIENRQFIFDRKSIHHLGSVDVTKKLLGLISRVGHETARPSL